MPLKIGIYVPEYDEPVNMDQPGVPELVKDKTQLFLSKGNITAGKFSYRDVNPEGKYWEIIHYAANLDVPGLLAQRKAIIVMEYCHFVFFCEMLLKGGPLFT